MFVGLIKRGDIPGIGRGLQPNTPKCHEGQSKMTGVLRAPEYVGKSLQRTSHVEREQNVTILSWGNENAG